MSTIKTKLLTTHLSKTDWNAEENEAAGGGAEATKHLWEESWDDDDTTDDFSIQLKYAIHTAPSITYIIAPIC